MLLSHLNSHGDDMTICAEAPQTRPIQYVRLTVRVGPDDRVITVWAIDLGVRKGWRSFKVVGRDGEPKDRIIVGYAESDDWRSIRPARMNLMYAELEVVD